ncbi:MAG: amidohydrolase [Alphaproteobacteria bacterium]|nr:amidohydrolase [Alphaproteobacteria bacterium]
MTADLLLTGGKIITLDGAGRIADSLAVRGDRILAVGRADDLRSLAGPATRTIALGGRAVVPGLVDAHAHMDREGLKSVYPSLSGCTSIDDVLMRVEALLKDKAPGEWLVTMPIGEPPFYWDVPNNLREKRMPTRWELDRVSPQNPVYIRPIWGYWRHILPIVSVANSKALALAGVGRATANPCDTVAIEKDANGEPTGIFIENTYVPVIELALFSMMPGFRHEHRVKALAESMRIYNATGTTSVFEGHGAAQELIAAYQAVRNAGAATVRATLAYSCAWMASGEPDPAGFLPSWLAWLGRGGLGDDWLRISVLHTQADIIDEQRLRVAAAPYTGWSGFFYDAGVPRAKMKDFLIAAARHDLRVVSLSADLLDIYAAVDKEVALAGRRWVIGHINTLTEAQCDTIARLGLIITTHTNNYVYKAGHMTLRQLGAARANEIVPIRGLADRGVTVALATDNVPTTMWWPVWQTIARKSLVTGEVIAPEQRMGRADALRLATANGAYLTGEEAVKGTIEAGKLADLAVLSADPLTCPEDAIRDIVAEATIVGGRVVYEREERP